MSSPLNTLTTRAASLRCFPSSRPSTPEFVPGSRLNLSFHNYEDFGWALAHTTYPTTESRNMLTLNGVNYGNIFCASGARGFFGEGYPFHRVMEHLGMTWEGTGFVSKTILVKERRGNMPMRADRLTPKERFIPRSVIVKPFSGHVLNAISLTGPGVKWALEQNEWQEMTDPFMISFMSIADTYEDRTDEAWEFVSRMGKYLDSFEAPFAIQFNCACPNTGHLPTDFYAGVYGMLDILTSLSAPIVVNLNSVVPGEVMLGIANHPACAALWIGNTIPWGDPRINWLELFGTEESPLSKRPLPYSTPGGLSGPACLPHTIERVLEARKLGVNIPIVAGNGIQHPSDVKVLRDAGADAVFIGTVGMMRPWRMKRIIRAAQLIY